jgi:hypothetical protein
MMLTDDSLLQRIRETVLRMARTPARVRTPPEETDDRTRLSLRQLSRTRVSQLLRQLRAAQGLTYAQVQERTGFTQQLLYDFEYRERRLTLEEVRSLAACYGVTVNDLLGVDVD